MFIFSRPCRLAIVAICLIMVCGCAKRVITFRFEPPAEYRVIPVKGLPEDAKAIEMVDRLLDDCAETDSLVIVVEEEDMPIAYKVSIVTGEANIYRDVKEPETKTYYWENFNQTGKTKGDILSGCLHSGCAIFGGSVAHTSERWGFEGERRFDCRSDDRVLTSYQYLEKKEYSQDMVYQYESTSWESGMTLKFVIGGDVVEINTARGYFEPSNKENTRRIRYYRIADGNVLGCAPDQKGPVGITNFILYDVNKQESWGAEMPMPEDYLYNDFAVTGDKAYGAMLAGNPGSYQLLVYDAVLLSKAVKLFKTIQ